VNVETNSAHPATGRRPIAMILVVDDEPDTLATLHLVLSMLGFEAVTARSAREALQRIEERLPELIITDSAMPSMSGLELCRVLRACHRTRRIPIVLHTGGELPEEVPRLYDRIITKPADVESVVKVVRELLPPGISGAR
jgi:CheY-like chemotaxis protein